MCNSRDGLKYTGDVRGCMERMLFYTRALSVYIRGFNNRGDPGSSLTKMLSCSAVDDSYCCIITSSPTHTNKAVPFSSCRDSLSVTQLLPSVKQSLISSASTQLSTPTASWSSYHIPQKAKFSGLQPGKVVKSCPLQFTAHLL